MTAASGQFPDHPPLELLLTVDEETGMSGARELDVSPLSARRMLNLDAEEQDVLYVGCAGGQDTIISASLQREPAPRGHVARELSIKGLSGGHSGLDILKNRGNAITLVADLLLQLESQGVPLRLVSFSGGSMRNAIPREAQATILAQPSDLDQLNPLLEQAEREILERHRDSEQAVQLSLAESSLDQAPIARAQAGAILRLFTTAPNGVLSMSQSIPGLVESSSNLGVVRTDEALLRATFCSRSSNSGALRLITRQLAALAQLCGCSSRLEGGYPGWQPSLRSPLLATATTLFTELAEGRAPKVTAIHAGLECGLLGAKIAGLDMISFGPTITGAHSPNERVSISSVAVVARQLGAMLHALC
jgi:dipeptidase D